MMGITMLDGETDDTLIMAASAHLPMQGFFEKIDPKDALAWRASEHAIRCPDCHRIVDECPTCGAKE
jgi:uncharacterized paraquat-inducible protein A